MSAKPANEKLQAIHGLLAEKSWTMADLCSHAKVSRLALRLLVYENQMNVRRAYKIEKALNAPIWTAADKFADLSRASDFLGVDFVLTKFHPLRSAAVAKGIRHTRSVTNKNTLLKLVLAHLANLETKPSK